MHSYYFAALEFNMIKNLMLFVKKDKLVQIKIKNEIYPCFIFWVTGIDIKYHSYVYSDLKNHFQIDLSVTFMI